MEMQMIMRIIYACIINWQMGIVMIMQMIMIRTSITIRVCDVIT